MLSEKAINLINEYQENKHNGYCEKCGNELYFNARNKLQEEINNLTTYMESNINSIPIATINSPPLDWKYEILGIVTGQSSTGTGVISEISSSFTDLIGGQSGKLNEKLKLGEQMCFNQIRLKTIDLGGNAVIATDIDYSEIGSGKGILMVCSAGTAIKLTNTELLGKEKVAILNELHFTKKKT